MDRIIRSKISENDTLTFNRFTKSQVLHCLLLGVFVVLHVSSALGEINIILEKRFFVFLQVYTSTCV